ncbi:CRISPR-associated helicase/endonuclease Cas3 [Thiorhodovibrio frisius]|uniref:CRISPR-associated helicase Cas3/CRISPR-associated endonuclease Cas3-HD n=1 Tax=Thiorhodovibrio frisius TaxID=631362 RepID=H8Z3W3_9GAMM|nr:CRISPR-associated helicase/endonuclease Cas3 [Thiorhodovibrio frisius]EIC21115.1 CRISPR-associated helicase Cas3/CRISPR-associated endonuclease Cas3-HD [Thiorhodovibrio frisius]WPL22175.1 CRISPR-associated helicase Cas3 [Thiorhodovibrio frisius]
MSSKKGFLAHARLDNQGRWHFHLLDDHLKAVARLASDFALLFGSSDWAAAAGLWHDLGKFRPRFQRYIREAVGLDPETAHLETRPGRAPHSTAGALLAERDMAIAGRVLAYVIAGHHAGLYDWDGGLKERMAGDDARDELAESLAAEPPPDILHPALPPRDLRQVPGGKEGFSLWVRMLFSCLVDADFLDTEAFMDPPQSERRAHWPELASLGPAFDKAMKALAEQASPTPVNQLRAEVLAHCRQAAEMEPGVFSLTVPTGGGKTLASMAFALRHAQRHGRRRVIHVIPYTSIIEQTAAVFRGIFGDAVLEHHSAAEATPDTENLRSRLACENWDAPIIVTTSVQFFESLFAARTSRCRKLHNIVNSVVVLDEVQLLPPALLQPIVDVMNLLAKHYGVTFVLATATQPVLGSRRYFDSARHFDGLDNVREIIPNPDALYDQLRRVRVRLPLDWRQPVSWETLAEELSHHDSALVIVNSRRHARELFRAMPPGALHLSALMCGAHRSRVIRRIRQRLADGVPTRVVSTQLVEAGVDLDFPVVYRALSGLDSIGQAAGRCNREGRMKQGEVVVFIPPEPPPAGLLRAAEDACRTTLHGIEDGDPLARSRFADYFERLYYSRDLDAHGIRRLLSIDDPKALNVQFRGAAEHFQMIEDDDSVSVVVLDRDTENNDIDMLLGSLRKNGPDRWLMRRLQRYMVTIGRRDALRLLDQGDVEEQVPGLFVQISDWLYDADLGLITEGAAPRPAQTIV